MTDEELEQIRQLRLMVSEPTSDVYDDQALLDVITQTGGDLRAAAAQVWEFKAAAFSTMVDESESGSSRSASQLHRNALAMAARYGAKDSEEIAAEAPRPTSRRAVRR